MENDFIEETNIKNRNGISDNKRWDGAVIPFTCDASFSESQKGILARAMARIQSISNIRFKTRTSETDYVHITRHYERCSSRIGKVGGRQLIKMGDLCFRISKDRTNGYHHALHEFLHAAGFYHQQNAPDRDEYLKINVDNIQDGKLNEFTIIDSETFNVPYDYCSIMHYTAYGFSKNGKPTMEKRKSTNCVTGFKPELSYRDIRNTIFNYY